MPITFGNREQLQLMTSLVYRFIHSRLVVLGNKTGFRSGALCVLCVLKDSYPGGMRVELGWFVTHTRTFLTMDWKIERLIFGY